MKYRIGIIITLSVALIVAIVILNSDVKIQVDGGTLYGTLRHESYDTLVILIAGSGPTDRDSNTAITGGRNDALKELAIALNNEGISTFNYDKRTSGKSVKTFDTSDIVFEDFINDGNYVLEEMKNKGYNNIYLFGHSQGALIAEVIGNDSRVSGVVSLCGTLRPIDEVIVEQLGAQSNELAEQSKVIFDSIKNNENNTDVPIELESLFTGNENFLRGWMSYNPLEYIEPIESKMLFIYGEMDSQVSGNEVKLINDASESNDSSNSSDASEFSDLVNSTYTVDESQVVIISNMNHVLKYITNDHENIESYSLPIYQLNEELLDTLLSFIL